ARFANARRSRLQSIVPDGIRTQPAVAPPVVADERMRHDDGSGLCVRKTGERSLAFWLEDQVQQRRRPAALRRHSKRRVIARVILWTVERKLPVVPRQPPEIPRQQKRPRAERRSEKPDRPLAARPVAHIDAVVGLTKPPARARKRRGAKILVLER